MKLILLLCALLLATGWGGCGQNIKIDPPPKVVHVTVDRYIPVPAELDADCYNEAAKEQSYNEAKRLANLRNESIKECNARAAKRRALQKGVSP